MFDLTPDNVAGYLKRKGIISENVPVEATALGWGISNIVLKVVLPDECMVIKQSLPKLRVKDEWLFDQSRIIIEHRCMTLMGQLLPPERVPAVRFVDDENFIFGMSCAPEGGVLWKEALMQGQVDLRAAADAGTLLAQWHLSGKDVPEVLESFCDNTNFIQGRVDPYHRTMAKVHPPLAPMIEAEVARMLEARQTLVHGDYSPKNLFAYPDYVMTLDLEVAHYGDPAFDTAFCINHLLLKAVKFAEQHEEYLAAAHEFWNAYQTGAGEKHFPSVEAHTVRELGCLMMARIDGKSKIEYIPDEPTRDFVRGVAADILFDTKMDVNGVIAMLDERLTKLQE